MKKMGREGGRSKIRMEESPGRFAEGERLWSIGGEAKKKLWNIFERKVESY